ncbi:hypothetical protein A4A49_36399 [Nicotiana attenuata]|uniref:Spt5 KOW domain-containing protein n=1 Tax=Nicotiana attenuata TaxID=49451 RepID=A0A1J6KSF0_NICAT|nr:hypothetical protein A4A49_36399 [Nicotiana attenuata]
MACFSGNNNRNKHMQLIGDTPACTFMKCGIMFLSLLPQEQLDRDANSLPVIRRNLSAGMKQKVVAVNDSWKKVTVKLIPRIDLQAIADKFVLDFKNILYFS